MTNRARVRTPSPSKDDQRISGTSRRRRRDAARATLDDEDDEWIPTSRTLLPTRAIGEFLESDYDMM